MGRRVGDWECPSLDGYLLNGWTGVGIYLESTYVKTQDSLSIGIAEVFCGYHVSMRRCHWTFTIYTVFSDYLGSLIFPATTSKKFLNVNKNFSNKHQYSFCIGFRTQFDFGE